MNTFKFVADVFSVIGGVIAAVLGCIVIYDRFFKLQFLISIKTKQVFLQESSMGFPNYADIPCVVVTLINHGRLTVHPVKMYLFINGAPIEPFPNGLKKTATTASGHPYLLPDPLEFSRQREVVFSGKELLDKLPESLQKLEKLKIQAVLETEDGRKFKSRRVTVFRKDIEPNL